MDLSVSHRYTETGLLFISFLVIFFYSPCIDTCIQSPIMTNFSTACNFCKDTGAHLVGLYHLLHDPTAHKFFVSGMENYSALWIDYGYRNISDAHCLQDKNTPCKFGNGDWLNASCSTTHHFFCYQNGTVVDPKCGNCSCSTPTNSAVTSNPTETEAEIADNTTSPAQSNQPTVYYIAISVAVGAVLVVIAVVAGCLIIRRFDKPVQNAVTEESAIGYGRTREPEIETREASPIPLNDIIVRSEEVEDDPDEETYNILRLSSKNGSESQVTESNGKKIYDHLRFGEKEDDYDTTCLSRLDGGPVDKPYDKTYFG